MTATGSTGRPAGPVARGRAGLRRPIAWYLRQLSRLMSVLTDEELERLIPLFSERKFEPRQVLFSAGDPPERVYLLLKGRVKVYQVADNGKEIIVDIVGQGGVVGDMAIVEGGERVTNAQTLEETVALSISWENFQHLLMSSPRLAFAMAELMARRLSGMQRSLLSMASKPVSARLAEALLDRAEGDQVHLGLTHQELAQTIATSRETVTALLSRFASMGAIAPASGGYRIVDEGLLRAIADGRVPVSPRHPTGDQTTAAAT